MPPRPFSGLPKFSAPEAIRDLDDVDARCMAEPPRVARRGGSPHQWRNEWGCVAQLSRRAQVRSATGYRIARSFTQVFTQTQTETPYDDNIGIVVFASYYR
jgi:hypothetical protein